MFCPNCGTKLPDEAVFCANCGAKLQAAPAAPVYEEPATARPVAVEPEAPVVERPVAAEPVSERPVVMREPVSARPAPQPVTERPAPKAPAAPVKIDDEVVAPANYTTVNIILMVVSILSCCSCPSVIAFVTSLIGVISGSGCKKAIAAGDLAAAQKKGKTAKIMWIISVVLLALSILFGAIVLILSFTGNISGAYIQDLLSEIK